jgi:hypothetical protein
MQLLIFACLAKPRLKGHGHGPYALQVQVQLYYMSVRVHRPLNVLCATWNVGNAVGGWSRAPCGADSGREGHCGGVPCRWCHL